MADFLEFRGEGWGVARFEEVELTLIRMFSSLLSKARPMAEPSSNATSAIMVGAWYVGGVRGDRQRLDFFFASWS